MSEIPDAQLRVIKDAAAAAYDDVRWAVGDSRELAAVLMRPGLEIWRAGYETGLRHGRDE